MKKYLSLIFAILLCLQLAACSGGKDKINVSDFKISEYDNGISVDGYVGKAADVVIPSKIDGKTVLAIGDGAFKRDRALTSVTIPDTVREIGDYAFWFCENLTGVVIGSGLELIGSHAFESSTEITSFTIKSNKLKEIYDYAFSHVESLEYLKLPESVESVGVNAFKDAFLLALGVKEGSYLHNYAKENDIPFITY